MSEHRDTAYRDVHYCIEDPSLDSRLSLIRRQSGLDSRAALFVLSPLSSAELQEFIQSLQDALFESATDYYTAHTKRVRRKKGRVPPQSSPIPAGSGPTTGRPLRNEGWLVRYEYKMATFAEFRMEDELARKSVGFSLASPLVADLRPGTTKIVGRDFLICLCLLPFCLQEPSVGQKRKSSPIQYLLR